MSRKIQVEDQLAFQLAGDVQMSPAGDRVAYIVKQTDKEKNSYQTAIYMGAPGKEPLRFTGGDSDGSPRFSPDGTHLAFVSRRSGQAQVWVISVAGGEARQLTKVQGGVGEFAWAPDGGRIAFTAMLKGDGIQPEVKEEKEEDLLKKHTKQVKVITELLHKMDGQGYYTERRPCICVTTLAEDAKPTQLTKPPYNLHELSWTPDSKQILFTGRLGEDYDREAFEELVYAIPAEGGEAKALTPAGMSCGGAEVSPDGTTVALFGNKTEEMGYDNTAIVLMPIGGGQLKRVAAHFDRPFGSAGIQDMPAPGGGKLTWSQDGKSLFTIASIDGSTQLVRVDIAEDKVSVLTNGERLIYSYSLDARCRKAAFGIADYQSPSNIYSRDVKEGTEERLTNLNSDLLAELELSVPERFTATSPDGTKVDSWLVKPHGFDAGKQYPAVLSVHGGPMGMYATSFFFEFQLLAAEGYTVVYCNPRGSLGYGEAHCMAIQKEWGNKDYADVIAALDQAIVDNPWIDTRRLGITGGSYGGFMTNWAVGHTDRFAAAVTGRSICDWRAMTGTGDGGPFWFKKTAGVPHWVDDAWYKQQSPITYVEHVKTPILIEHQEGDLRCPLEQGQIWFSAIKHLGRAPVRFVCYPDEFHGMNRTGKPWNRIHRLSEITSWFNQYLKAV